MNKAIKVRIYPTEEQQVLIDKTFGCCRWMWNTMLGERKNVYQETKKTIHLTPAKYKAENDWLKEVDSFALCNVQLNLEKAYKSFFEGLRGEGPKRGLPRFKSKKISKRSYTTNNHKVNGKYTLLLENEMLKLPKLGWVKCDVYRDVFDGVIKTVTVSEPTDGEYFASISFEIDCDTIPFESKEEYSVLGLDYASQSLYVDSEGNNCDMPHFYREGQKKLAKLQRRLSKKKLGSKNRDKARKKVKKQQEHVANQRKDFLHKKSTEIANRYDVVCVEDLNMKNISRSLKLGKATMDNGFGMFRNMLEYKLEDRGKRFIKVDKWFPSTQLCSCCGYKNPETKDLKVTEWTCPQCNTHHDRNINAAINIREEGKRMLNSSDAA